MNLFPFPLSKTKMIGEFCINGQSAGGNWVHLLLCPLQAQAQCNSGNALARKNRQILFTFITLWCTGILVTLRLYLSLGNAAALVPVIINLTRRRKEGIGEGEIRVGGVREGGLKGLFFVLKEPIRNIWFTVLLCYCNCIVEPRQVGSLSRIFSQAGFFSRFSTYIINLAGRQLYIVTWDEERSCEAAIGGLGARSAHFARSTTKPHKIQRLNGRVYKWPGWKLRRKDEDGGWVKLAENLQGAPKQNWRTYFSTNCPVMTYLLAENLQGAPKQNWHTYFSAYCPVMTYLLAENPQGAPFYIT